MDEKCWADAHLLSVITSKPQIDCYRELLFERKTKDLESRLQQAEADNADLLDWMEAFHEDCSEWEDGNRDPEEVLCDMQRALDDLILNTPHPGAALLEELEQYKASDASKEQSSMDNYNRAREAERELADYKKALELAAIVLNKCPESSVYECHDYPSRFPDCTECRVSALLARAKEELNETK